MFKFLQGKFSNQIVECAEICASFVVFTMDEIIELENSSRSIRIVEQPKMLLNRSIQTDPNEKSISFYIQLTLAYFQCY